MTARGAVVGALVLLVLVAPLAAGAWSVGRGTRIMNGDDALVVAMDGLTLSTLTFNATGAPVLDGIAIDLEDPTGARSWNLLEWNPARQIRISGPATGSATFSISGLTGQWRALGVRGEPLFTASGGPYVVTDTITLTPDAAGTGTTPTPTPTPVVKPTPEIEEEEEDVPISGVVALTTPRPQLLVPPIFLAIAGLGLILAFRGKRKSSRKGGAGLAIALVVLLVALNLEYLKEVVM